MRANGLDFFVNFIILGFYVEKPKDLEASSKAVVDFHNIGDFGRKAVIRIFLRN